MMADPLFSPTDLPGPIKEEMDPEQLVMPEITIKNEPLSPPPQSILDQEYEARCGAVKVEPGSCMSVRVKSEGLQTTNVPHQDSSAAAAAASRTPGLCSNSSSTLQSTFLEAVQRGNVGVVEHLLDVGDISVNGFDASDGQTALHRACCDGQVDMVRLLVRYGADVRLCNRDGWSALHLAVWSRKQELVRYLLSALKLRPR